MLLKIKPQPTAWILWLIFIVAICILIILSGYNRTVSLNYWLAAKHWIEGQPLYSLKGAGFIYFPQSAILYTPLALLPFHVSEIFWRIISLSMFAWGIYCFATLTQQGVFNQVKTGSTYNYINSQGFFFLLMTLIAIPLSFSSARNGQMHLFMVGLLLWALYALSKRHWWKSACLLVIAFALKPTAIVLLLMVAGLYWAVGWRLLIGLIILSGFPFLTQSPHYVWHQYLDGIISLKKTVELGSNGNWAQIFSLLTQFGVEIDKYVQTITRLLSALIIFALGYLIKKRYSINETTLWVFGLSICYLLLFNPRTESNGYFMLAPAMGLIMGAAIIKRRYAVICLLIILLLAFISGYYITAALTPGHSAWLDPILGLIFFVIVLVEVFRMLLRKNVHLNMRKFYEPIDQSSL